MKVKKTLALLLAAAMMVGLAACGGNSASTSTPAASTPAASTSAASGEATEISLWTYPIGKWGDEATVSELMAGFEAETGIKVNVEYLDYTNGDDKVNTAITAGNAPDLVMEAPERLVSNWGANGYMVDLSDMFDDEDKAEIYEGALSNCVYSGNGETYSYPLVMTAHCMAINKQAFEAAGALQYIDEETHTWSTEDFINAVNALYAYYGETVGAVFCNGQGGDQGTRALVSNLYSGALVNADRTAYTWDNPNNIKALQTLYDLDGIDFDASIVGGDEIALFYQGVLKMAFCWNIAQQQDPNLAGTGAEKTVTGDDIVFMAFPTDSGDPVLEGGIWGFGIFDNGDEARIAAAKEFIKYFCDSEHTVDAVRAASYFAARSSAEGTDLTGVWADNEIMNEYTKITPYLGPYLQVTPGWTQARTSWWNMLQDIGEGADITETVTTFMAEANAAAAG